MMHNAPIRLMNYTPAFNRLNTNIAGNSFNGHE